MRLTGVFFQPDWERSHSNRGITRSPVYALGVTLGDAISTKIHGFLVTYATLLGASVFPGSTRVKPVYEPVVTNQ